MPLTFEQGAYLYRGPRSRETLRLTRVTNATGAYPKPALAPWYAKVTAERAVGEIEHWQSLGSPEDAVAYIKRAPTDLRDRAADLGTHVHRMIESRTKDGPIPVWPLPVQAHMERFEDFMDAHQPEFLMSEGKVANLTYRYAGTLDAVVRLGGRTGVLDIKSSSGVWPEHALQLAAYARAEFAQIGAVEAPLPEIEAGWILHIRPEGYRLHEANIGEDTFETFLALLEVVRWQAECADHAIGPEIIAAREAA